MKPSTRVPLLSLTTAAMVTVMAFMILPKVFRLSGGLRGKVESAVKRVRLPTKAAKTRKWTVPAGSRFGVYYINQNWSLPRQAYMENMFQKYFGNSALELIRVNEIDQNNTTHLHEHFDLRPGRVIDENVSASCGSISYFKALARAYEDDCDVVLILEDNASFELVPHWPTPLKDIAADLSATDPDWDALLLSYTVPTAEAQQAILVEWKSSYPNLPKFVRWYNNASSPGNKTAFTGDVYDSVAILWSRKALKRLMTEPINRGAAEPSTSAVRTHHLKGSTYCALDAHLNYLALNQFILTPPYFTYQLADISLNPQTGKDSLALNGTARMQSRLFASRFFVEALEMQSVPPNHLPAFTWVPKDLSKQEIAALGSPGQQLPAETFASETGGTKHGPEPQQASSSGNQRSVGVYYMNLERSPQRRNYTERMFRKYLSGADYELIRVNAVDQSNTTQVRRVFGLGPSDDVEKHIHSICEATGAIGPTLTYLRAMARAYDDDRDIALIMEDDASFEFVPSWSKTVRELATELTAIDPDWEVIRLSYIAAPAIGGGAIFVLQEWKSQYPHLPAFKKWQNPAEMKRLKLNNRNVHTALAGRLFDTVANLWSRKGLERFTSEYVDLNNRTDAGFMDPEDRYIIKFGRKHFNEAKTCTIDLYLNAIMLNEYITTPPYFTYRLAEGSQGHRTKGKDLIINDHARAHITARLFATQFNVEATELQYFPPSSLGQFKWVI